MQTGICTSVFLYPHIKIKDGINMNKFLSKVLSFFLAVSLIPCAAFADEKKENAFDGQKLCFDMTNDTALNMLRGKTALCVGNASIFYDGEKHKTDAPAFIEDGRTLVPVRAVSEAFKLSVDWDEATQTVTIDNSSKIVIGKNEITLPDSSVYKTDVPAKTVNDRTYLPLRALCEKILGKEVSWDGRGVIIIADEQYPNLADDAYEIFSYLTYDRPENGEITSLFNSVNGNTHPRVILNRDSYEQLLYNYKNDANVKSWGNTVINTAKGMIDLKLPEYIIPDGMRLLDTSRDVYKKAKYLGMAYLLTEDKTYADALYKILEAAGSFPDWNPRHFLDTAEMTMAFAIGYDWLYNYWTDEQRDFLADKIYNYGLVNGVNFYCGNFVPNVVSKWTINNKTNWNGVCNAGMVCGAIAVFDRYSDTCSQIVSCGIRNLEPMLSSFYPDGAWFEGVSYWVYAMSYTVNMFSTLEAAFKTDFNLSKAPGMENTVKFHMSSDGMTAINNFHDANASRSSSDTYFYLADKFNIPGATAARMYYMTSRKYEPTPLDLIFYKPSENNNGFSMPLDNYFRDIEYVSMQSSWTDDNGTWLSAHGGVAASNHTHLDTGSFVADLGGIRWACDLGADNYNLDGYFGSKKHMYYRLRPEGHNLYVINPSDGSEGQSLTSKCYFENFVSKEKGAFAILDLTPAYENYTTSAKRGYYIANDRRSVVIRDEMTLKADNSEIYWFMHTQADVEIIDSHTAKLTRAGKELIFKIDSNITDYEFAVMDAVPLSTSPVMPEQNANSGYRKLYLHANVSGSVYIQCKLILADDPCAELDMDSSALSEWTVADGPANKIPSLDAIYLNGEKIDGFDPSSRSYTFPINFGDPLPEITYDADEKLNVIIDKPEQIGKDIKIRVEYKSDPTLYNMYTLSPSISVMEINFDGNQTYLKPYKIYGNGGDVNKPYQLGDNDLSKPWTAQNTKWVVYEFRNPVKIGGMALSCGLGDKRVYTFDVEISKDGKAWIPVKTDMHNSGTTTDFEYYDLGNNEEVKYVRFTGKAYAGGSWNNYNELCYYESEDQYKSDVSVRDKRFSIAGYNMGLGANSSADLSLYISADGKTRLDNSELSATAVSSDNSVAVCDGLVITGVKSGEAYIEVTARYNGSVYCKKFKVIVK